MAGKNERALLSGDIRYFRLPEVLQLIALQRLTGRLTLTRSGQDVDIYIRDGHVAFATGEKRSSREQLGFLLVRMGCITQETLERALAESVRLEKRLGEVLQESGAVKPDGIRAALLKQTERAIYKAMAWGEGRFSFEPCAMPDFAEEMPVALRVEELILEGVRRIGEVRWISERIPSLKAVFTKSPYTAEELDSIGLKDGDRQLLELIDGKRDVKGLIEASGMEKFAVLKALHALLSIGIVKAPGPAEKPARTQYL